MSVLLPLLLTYSLPSASALLCSSGISNELLPVTNEFSTCNGTVCFITAYSFRFPQYHGLVAYEMGCLSAPYQLPLGCRKDESGNSLCLCGEDYCNDEILLTNRTGVVAIASVTCTTFDSRDYMPVTGSCRASLCTTEVTSYMNYRGCVAPYDASDFYILGSFDLFYVGFYGYMWPAQSCLRMDAELVYQGETEYCNYGYDYTLPNNTMNKLEKQTVCRYSPTDSSSTCVGNLCFVAENSQGKVAMGCVQQTNPKGFKLLPGFYDFHSSRLFVCNTTMCNGDHDAYGNRKENWLVVDGTPTYWTDSMLANVTCCPRGEQKKKTSPGYSHCLVVLPIFISLMV